MAFALCLASIGYSAGSSLLLTSLKSCICASLASTLWAQNMIGQSTDPFCPWSALVHIPWALLSGPGLLAPSTGFGLGLGIMDVRVQTLSG